MSPARILCAVLLAWAGGAVAADPGCAALAPTGKLRAGMNLSNTLFMKQEAGGELAGVSVDVVREVASRLGVPVEFVVHPTPGHVADAAASGTWDVALIAIEESRAKTIAFTAPLTEIDVTYALSADSRMRIVAEVDAPGVRVAAAEKSAYELYLSKTLREATVVRTKQLEGAVAAFDAGQVNAVAGLRPALIAAFGRNQGVRILDGRFMVLTHGLGVPREREAGAACLEAIVKELRSSGFVARSIERHGIPGLSAAR